MAKIYDENGTRMTNEQVAIALKDIMPQNHKNLLAIALGTNGVGGTDNRRMFAHAVLDAYRLMEIGTPEQDKSKKWCKYLLDKYMKSTTPATTAEDKAIKDLIDNIWSTAEVE